MPLSIHTLSPTAPAATSPSPDPDGSRNDQPHAGTGLVQQRGQAEPGAAGGREPVGGRLVGRLVDRARGEHGCRRRWLPVGASAAPDIVATHAASSGIHRSAWLSATCAAAERPSMICVSNLHAVAAGAQGPGRRREYRARTTTPSTARRLTGQVPSASARALMARLTRIQPPVPSIARDDQDHEDPRRTDEAARPRVVLSHGWVPSRRRGGARIPGAPVSMPSTWAISKPPLTRRCGGPESFVGGSAASDFFRRTAARGRPTTRRHRGMSAGTAPRTPGGAARDGTAAAESE